MDKRCRNPVRRSMTREEAETYDRMITKVERLELNLKQAAIKSNLEKIVKGERKDDEL